MCYWTCPVKGPWRKVPWSPATLAPVGVLEVWSCPRSLPPGRLQTLMYGTLPTCGRDTDGCHSSIQPRRVWRIYGWKKNTLLLLQRKKKKQQQKKSSSFLFKGFQCLKAWNTNNVEVFQAFKYIILRQPSMKTLLWP